MLHEVLLGLVEHRLTRLAVQPEGTPGLAGAGAERCHHLLVAAHLDVGLPTGAAAGVATHRLVKRRNTALAACDVDDFVDIVAVVLQCQRLGRERRHVRVVVACNQ